MAGLSKERSASPSTKRKADAHDPSISPPPMKRQVQSAVTKSSVASFFTPASQRPKSQVKWEERAPANDEPTSLLVARFASQDASASTQVPGKRKIAAFDLDSTLILPASGKKHAESARDWKWFHPKVPQTLKELSSDGFAVAVFSNQGGLKLHPDASAKKAKTPARDRVAEFKQKCGMVLTELALPVSLYGATGKDRFRKPQTGMWDELCADLGLSKDDIDLEHSFFVGDAAGRGPRIKSGKTVPKDFSCSDRNMAANIGISFQTPEEYFHDESPVPFERGFDLGHHPFSPIKAEEVFKKGDGKEVVVFCGPPGAGKSTFFRDHLEVHDIERINQDTLKTKDKCLKTAEGYLKEGRSVAIDNTNPDPAARAVWIELAKKHNATARCVWFKTNPALCEHNDTVRSSNKVLNPDNRTLLPKIAFNTFFSRFKEPTAAEGFADITEVDFKFRGTEEEYALWGQYWV